MPTYKILRTHPTDENTEIRLSQIERGYSVGVWDNDVNEYYPGLRIYTSLEDAEKYFKRMTK